jgi:hypothetical protein
MFWIGKQARNIDTHFPSTNDNHVHISMVTVLEGKITDAEKKSRN